MGLSLHQEQVTLIFLRTIIKNNSLRVALDFKSPALPKSGTEYTHYNSITWSSSISVIKYMYWSCILRIPPIIHFDNFAVHSSIVDLLLQQLKVDIYSGFRKNCYWVCFHTCSISGHPGEYCWCRSAHQDSHVTDAPPLHSCNTCDHPLHHLGSRGQHDLSPHI